MEEVNKIFKALKDDVLAAKTSRALTYHFRELIPGEIRDAICDGLSATLMAIMNGWLRMPNLNKKDKRVVIHRVSP